MIRVPKPWENAEGYPDPTAYHGMKPVIRAEKREQMEQKRVDTLIFVLKYIINLAGYDLVHRIAIRDRKSGKEYR